MRIVLWWATNLAALWAAAKLVDGITYGSVGWLVLAALVFGVVNLVVRPVIVLLALPAVILTLGLALLLVNALMLLLTGALVPQFEVSDFFWAAVLGALIVWVVNMLLHAVRRDAAGWRGRLGF
ncbi:MAG: phage holin family protein [Thermoleophilia bacterium]|nr:phage holin family protein [Thermoleophilia bacterium]